MHIQYAHIVGCQRFHLSHLRELELEFTKPVTIVAGRSGEGKTSLLHELCPLPATRKTYAKNGRKEIRLTHDGHEYVLLSDFTNRTAPHSFKRDGEELNVSGTTDVQSELVISHLGLTPAMRNLIYNQTEMCRLTNAERRNLFLSINPMDLRLILAAHKAVQGNFRDAKAQITLLHGRKVDLQSRMLSDEVLAQHRLTKERLSHELSEIEKLIYALEQHVTRLKNLYRDDLAYRQECLDHNRQLIPTEEIKSGCLSIRHDVRNYRDVVRGDGYSAARESVRADMERAQSEQQHAAQMVQSLSREINDYQQHLERAQDTPVDALEKELDDLEKNIQRYGVLIDDPVPKEHWDEYRRGLEQIKSIVMVFHESEVSMLNPDELEQRIRRLDNMRQELSLLTERISRCEREIADGEQNIARHRGEAQIPEQCQYPTCGLRSRVAQVVQEIQTRVVQTRETLGKLQEQQQKLHVCYTQEQEQLSPYVQMRAVEQYRRLLYWLNSRYYRTHDWESDLLTRLNTQPLLILAELDKRLEQSEAWYQRQELIQRRQQLSTKLETLMKSSGTSVEFLQKKLAEKEKQLHHDLAVVEQLASREAKSRQQYQAYLDYDRAVCQLEHYQEIFSRGERALIAAKALEYWRECGRQLVTAKQQISEELRQLETILRDQEVLHRTYQDETIALLDRVAADKSVYEKMELALSPSVGIPHKSMVRYLNALIHNVNVFLSQLWSYPMKIDEVDPDSPLDYGLRVEVSGTVVDDIKLLSEGQSEVVNLAWVLTILLQMRMLDKIPLYADELGRAFDSDHRARLLRFLNQLIDQKYIDQMFLVSHYSELIEGFNDANIVYLGRDNGVLPSHVNEHARFVYE